MWMVSNLLYSTIIFIEGKRSWWLFLYCCLSSCDLRNTMFWNIMTEIEKSGVYQFNFLLAWRERGGSDFSNKTKKIHLLLFYLSQLTSLNISTSRTVWIFLSRSVQIWVVAVSKPSGPTQLTFQFQSLNAKKGRKKERKKWKHRQMIVVG